MRYAHIQELLPVIKEMVVADKTYCETTEHYGYKDKEVVKALLQRAQMKARSIPKMRGRKSAKTLQEYSTRIASLWSGADSAVHSGVYSMTNT